MRVIQAVLITAAALASSKALAASYDCSKATTYSEKAICNNPELSSLDNELSIAYKEAIGSATEQKAAYIRSVQREWLKLRNSCKEEQCILNAVTSRISELKANGITLAAPAEPVAEVQAGKHVQTSNETARVEDAAETRKSVELPSEPQAQKPNSRVSDLSKAYKFYICSGMFVSLNQLIQQTKGAPDEKFVRLGVDFAVAGISYSSTDIFNLVWLSYKEQYDRSFRQPGGLPTAEWLKQEMTKCSKLYAESMDYIKNNGDEARGEYFGLIDGIL